MAKIKDDKKTLELVGIDRPKGRGGRLPVGTSAMSDAERKRRQRTLANQKQVAIDRDLWHCLQSLAESKGQTVEQMLIDFVLTKQT